MQHLEHSKGSIRPLLIDKMHRDDKLVCIYYYIGINVFSINHSGIQMHMKNDSVIFVRHYLFSLPTIPGARGVLSCSLPARTLRSEVKRMGRGKVTTPL